MLDDALRSSVEMAFCPHCGKGVTEQASACPACGESIDTSTTAKTKAARFRGTIMTAGSQLQPAAATAAPQVPPAATPPAVSTRKPGTMMGVGLPARDPIPAPSEARAPESPNPPPVAAPPPPKATVPPADAIVRRPAASENRALLDPPNSAHDRARRPEGRFVAGPVPPPLARPGSNRWIAIGLAGMALIATAGYLVAQFLGLIH
jgi:hypothetical protein